MSWDIYGGMVFKIYSLGDSYLDTLRDHSSEEASEQNEK